MGSGRINPDEIQISNGQSSTSSDVIKKQTVKTKQKGFKKQTVKT